MSPSFIRGTPHLTHAFSFLPPSTRIPPPTPSDRALPPGARGEQKGDRGVHIEAEEQSHRPGLPRQGPSRGPARRPRSTGIPFRVPAVRRIRPDRLHDGHIQRNVRQVMCYFLFTYLQASSLLLVHILTTRVASGVFRWHTHTPRLCLPCPPSRLGSTSLIKARRGKRAGTSRLYARRLWKGRSIYSRATEKGPAFCECFVRAQRRASPLGPGCTSMICCATKEMMQPCLSYLHFISLVAHHTRTHTPTHPHTPSFLAACCAGDPPLPPVSTSPACHLAAPHHSTVCIDSWLPPPRRVAGGGRGSVRTTPAPVAEGIHSGGDPSSAHGAGPPTT